MEPPPEARSAAEDEPPLPGIGVVIVAFRSADVIGACLDSLLASTHRPSRIIVCDNACPDDSAGVVRAWAARHRIALAETSPGDAAPDAPAVLVRIGENRGYAGAINVALDLLRQDPAIALFWILNPDCVVRADAAEAFARAARSGPGFGLMGGRLVYMQAPEIVQSDGGRVSRWTGICRNLNQGLASAEAIPPDPATLDFVSGASVLVSRHFLESVGPMPEDYFLYYEEVDWAAQRGGLPIRMVPEAVILHHCGTAIGSGTLGRKAQPMSLWFNYRNRMRFMRRFHAAALPISWVASMARVAKLFLTGDVAGGAAALRGLNGLAPPPAVAARLPPAVFRQH
jgi:GT2 family glycosyltransferase